MDAETRREWTRLALFAAVFGALYFAPVGTARFDGALLEAVAMSRDYAREHVILCLLPAFWISGAIAVFVSKGAVLRFLGPKAHPVVAYGVASVSGTILAVCSCTVLPLFAGIYRMGAGLGPASAFLYSGPAINVLAIVMTAKVGMRMLRSRSSFTVRASTCSLTCIYYSKTDSPQRARRTQRGKTPLIGANSR